MTNLALLNKPAFFIQSRFAIRVFTILTVLVLVNLSTRFAFAQKAEPVYRRYTVDDGLPSSLLYHAFQDSKGYIWFATANGVSRFDGYKFENFDLQSGLVDNDVFEIYEDYKHRIWFIPMSGLLCYYENGKIVQYPYNNKLKYNSTHRGPIKKSFYVDTLDNVYISMRRSGLYTVSCEGVVSVNVNEDNIGLVIEEKPNGIVLYSNIFNDSKFIKFKNKYQSFTTTSKELGFSVLNNPLHLFTYTFHDSSTFFSIFYGVVIFKKGKLTYFKNYESEIIWMNIDRSNNLWICFGKGGAYCFPNCEVTKPPSKILLEENKVSSVLQDKEGAYWFTTLNDGVFYCPSINKVNYTTKTGLEDNRINAIAVNKEGIYVGYDFGFVDFITDKGIINYKSINDKVKSPVVRNLLIDKINNRVWISAIENLYYLQNGKVYAMSKTPSNASLITKKVFVDSVGDCWFAITHGLAHYDGKNIVYESYANNEFNSIVYDLIKDNKGTIWFCSINGLWSYSGGNNYQFMGSKNPLFAITSYSLILNPIDSSIWIGTNGAGIVIKQGDSISQITKKNGLISNSISQMYYSDGEVWVATRNGLSRIVGNKNKYKIINYTIANGLPTNQVTSVREYNGKVYVGTTQGLTVFEKNEGIEGSASPSIVISGIKVNDKIINLKDSLLSLNYDQNSFSIDFVGFVYRNNGKVNYRFRMFGIDSSWAYTQTPNCQYSELTDGEFTFEVQAQNFDGIWSDKSAKVSFSIHPPFWKRIWFLILIILSFTGLFFFIYRIRVNSINRSNALVQNVNLYKQQSLRQQMNPHFIFNTLNSIQLYILEKDSISSHKYLTKFARLMRMTLDNSLYSTIPLKDEIEALRLYLDLEKLRLENRFDYTIDCGKNNSILNFEVPTLLIQPFVENAIWHGISLRKDQMGWVKIFLVDNGNSLTCIVEDNGVGRAVADQIRQTRNKEHKSRGSQITQQRIDLLSQMYKENFSIVYNDLFDDNGNPLGTRVSVTIPKDVNVNLRS